jgi:uncharacterized protein
MKTYRASSLLCFSFMALYLGCATTPPSSYYMLTSSSTTLKETATKEHITLGVGPIKIPGHLDRAHIVTRLGAHVLKIHEFQRWGDSLQRQLEETLAENLSSFLQTPHVVLYPWERAQRPQYQLIITVRQLEGDLKMGTTVEAIWQLVEVETDQLKLTRHFMTTIRSSKATIEAYVHSQSRALEALSEHIAQGIADLAETH